MKYLTDLAIIIIVSWQQFFLVDSKMDSNQKECTNPKSLESESCSLEIVFIRSKG